MPWVSFIHEYHRFKYLGHLPLFPQVYWKGAGLKAEWLQQHTNMTCQTAKQWLSSLCHKVAFPFECNTELRENKSLPNRIKRKFLNESMLFYKQEQNKKTPFSSRCALRLAKSHPSTSLCQECGQRNKCNRKISALPELAEQVHRACHYCPLNRGFIEKV